MKITISGDPGSGKSTVAKLLAGRLNYRYHSVGELMRKLAKEKKISLMEFSKQAEEDSGIDKELDKMQIELGEKEDNFIMDSRLGFHFVPDSFKIFLKVDVEEAARRIHKDSRAVETYEHMEDALQSLKRRKLSEMKRYKDYYGINLNDKQKFDLVIDTTKNTAEKTVKEIIEKIGHT